MAASLPPPERLNQPPAWALARVPGLEQGEPPKSVMRLDGGSVNEVFRLESRVGAFVLRLNGAGWRRPGVDRARELSLHRSAAAAGVAPAIVAAEPAREGLLITAFEPGRLWRPDDYAEVGALRRLGERLQVLHALAPPPVAAFDPWAIAQGYLSAIPCAHELPPEPLARLELACASLRSNALPPCIAHGDLAQGNLIQGQRLWLIDWEYAQRSDALMDIACVLAYYPAATVHAAELAAAAGIDADPQGLRLRVYVYQALSWLWSLARGEPALPPAA
jgi:aminoglycoside phosphotransferase (APT) family kinase protein